MSNRVFAWALDRSLEKPLNKFVLVVVADSTPRDGIIKKDVARDAAVSLTGISPEQVDEILSELVHDGMMRLYGETYYKLGTFVV